MASARQLLSVLKSSMRDASYVTGLLLLFLIV